MSPLGHCWGGEGVHRFILHIKVHNKVAFSMVSNALVFLFHVKRHLPVTSLRTLYLCIVLIDFKYCCSV